MNATAPSPRHARGAAARDRVTLHVREVPSLAAAEIDEIWALCDRFVETDRAHFERKLRRYPEVVLCRNSRGELVGTVSLDVYPVRFQGREVSVVLTAGVVIDEPYRRRGILERVGVRTYLRTRLRTPFRPVYWLFDTFSFKSFLLLPRNFADYWPRKEAPTPPPVRELMDALAAARYGADWDPARGIVVRSGRKRLRPHTAPIDAALLSDPDVRFFESVNPGHREGDMLVCLCPLTLRNMLHMARSRLRRLVRR